MESLGDEAHPGAVASCGGATSDALLTGCPTPGPYGNGLLTDDAVAAALHAVREAGDDELVARARELLARTQRERPPRQSVGVAATDLLLREARRRGHPRVLGQLLRYASVVRLVTDTPLVRVDPLLDELVALAARHYLPVLLADAHALRARRAVLAGTEEAALADAATALALLAEPPAAEPGDRRVLACALIDLGLVLTQLGAHELADEVFERSERHLLVAGGCLEQLVNGLNRLRLLLSWALRLERAGHVGQAAERLAAAAAVGHEVEPMWPRTMFHSGDRPPAEQCAVLGASFALADPGPEHVSRLRHLVENANFTADRIMVAIGLGRSLERSGLVADAVAAVAAVRDALDGSGRCEPMLQLALSRELARLQEELTPGGPGTDSIRDYALALESEMWSLRQARIAAMRIQADHLRLTAEHGAVAEQAMSDPLTGLPNRRALDELLRRVLATRSGAPCAVALVDLDGFKNVNDRRSHAYGDEVLRAVAGAVRCSLRGEDTVARYGGDEFVVVLPGTPLLAARAALQRAVVAVAALPPGQGAGVTLSAGVIGAAAGDTAEQVLARADAAMYRAKRLGGNRVETGVEGAVPPGVDAGPRTAT
ncbi:MAG: diguanylate cyclase [Pseudonocardiaceae bacterium]